MTLSERTTFTPEMAEKICEAVACSEYGLRKTLLDNGLPPLGTVQTWLQEHSSFSLDYARAKRQQLENMAEDIVDISRDDSLEPNDKRIRIDTLKWLLSKLIPKTYGDKLDVTSDGKALAVPSHQIDARVQSIIMQARERKRGAVDILSELDDEARGLLE